MNKHFGLAAIAAFALIGVAPVFAAQPMNLEKVPLSSMIPQGMVLAAGEQVFCTQDVGLVEVAPGVFVFGLREDGADTTACLPTVDPFTGALL